MQKYIVKNRANSKKTKTFWRGKRIWQKLYTMNSKFFNKIDTELKAYLLGFYVGDGSIYIRRDRKEYSIKFSQVLDNKYIIDLIIKTIGYRNIQTVKAKHI